MSRITMEEIRKKYPNPVSAYNADEENLCEYCVGGAFCLFVEEENRPPSRRFPSANIVGKMLCEVNENLTPEKVFNFASQIIISNDAENFENAWKWLDMALKYEGKK